MVVPRMAANSMPGTTSRDDAVSADTSASSGPDAVTRDRQETRSRRIIGRRQWRAGGVTGSVGCKFRWAAARAAMRANAGAAMVPP